MILTHPCVYNQNKAHTNTITYANHIQIHINQMKLKSKWSMMVCYHPSAVQTSLVPVGDEKLSTIHKSRHTIASSAYALEWVLAFDTSNTLALVSVRFRGSFWFHRRKVFAICVWAWVCLVNKHNLPTCIRMGGVTHSMDRFISDGWFSIKYPFYEWIKRWRTYRITFSFVMLSSMGLSTWCVYGRITETARTAMEREKSNENKTENTVHLPVSPAFLRMHVGIPHQFLRMGFPRVLEILCVWPIVALIPVKILSPQFFKNKVVRMICKNESSV